MILLYPAQMFCLPMLTNFKCTVFSWQMLLSVQEADRYVASILEVDMYVASILGVDRYVASVLEVDRYVASIP